MTIKYLHDIVLGAIDLHMKALKTFSAWDITKTVRAITEEVRNEAVSASEVLVIGDCLPQADGIYFIEHARVKSLVHAFMSVYDASKFTKNDNGKFIEYTPVFTPTIYKGSPVQISTTPFQGIPTPANSPSSTGQGVNVPSPSTVTKINTSDKQLLESALEILKRNGLI